MLTLIPSHLAVIACIKDEGILSCAGLIQHSQQIADVAVDLRDHCPVAASRFSALWRIVAIAPRWGLLLIVVLIQASRQGFDGTVRARDGW